MRAAAVIAVVFALGAPCATLAQEPVPAAARAAQAPRSAPAPRAPAPAPAAPAAPAAPGSAPVVAVDPAPGQLVNVQIDIVLVAEGGSDGTSRKTMTLTLADRQEGSVRSIERSAGAQGTLNVDARPVVQTNGRVLTRIGLEFQSGNEVPFVQVRAQPLLESGKALRVSRAVSPKGDRSVTVEVTATVLR